MGLFSNSDFLFSAASAGRTQPEWTRRWRESVAQVRAVRALCAQSHLHGAAFISELLRQLQITIRYEPAALRRLPSRGAFLVVANQSASLLDELVLLHVLGQHRPELRLVASKTLTTQLPQLARQLVPTAAAHRAGGQILPMLRYLHNDVPVALFASDNESSPVLPLRPLPTPAGPLLVDKLLATIQLPIVSIQISHQGGASAHASWFGLALPWLRPLSVPAELLDQRGCTVQVQIGPVFSPPELSYLPPAARWPWMRTQLAAPRKWPATAAWPTLPSSTATTADLIEAELSALGPARRLLAHGPWEVYVARRAEVPCVVAEIVHLRRLMQPVGVPPPPDTFDAHHHHVFLYQREARCLVGAYRLGKGRVILRQHGKRGFYCHSLFRLKKEGLSLLRESLELGRACIRPEYQQQPLPSILLWKALAEYVATHPEYRYLIAPVIISESASPVSKSFVARYLKRNLLAAEWARWVRPRKLWRYHPLAAGEAPTSPQTEGHSTRHHVEQLLAHLAPADLPAPPLLHPFLTQNTRFLGFNLAPGCTNTLSGLLLLDARELPLRALYLLDRPA